jgi:hypothetical protein
MKILGHWQSDIETDFNNQNYNKYWHQYCNTNCSELN